MIISPGLDVKHSLHMRARVDNNITRLAIGKGNARDEESNILPLEFMSTLNPVGIDSVDLGFWILLLNVKETR